MIKRKRGDNLDLSNEEYRRKFLAQEVIFKSSSFTQNLLKRLFKLSDKLSAADKLSNTQQSSLLNKFKERKEDKSLKGISVINEYIKGQIDKDKAENSWAQQIGNESYGKILIDEFDKFKQSLKNDLGQYLSAKELTEKIKEEFKEYWNEAQDEFELELYQRFLNLFFMVEDYGKEYYQEFLDKEELTWPIV